MKVDISTPFALLASLDRESRRVNREYQRDSSSGWRGVLLAVGEFRFLVDMEAISEVTDPMSLTHVPLADPMVLGVGNLRGLVLPVFDLGRLLLGEPLAGDSSRQRIVVAPQGQGMAGLLVSRVEGMRNCAPHQRRLEVDVPEAARPFVTGGFDLGHRLHPVLDLNRLLNDTGRFAGLETAEPAEGQQQAVAS
ncbi:MULTISPECIES: chemotaxis protein CheW [unclassified Thioalkalivibrio]|uniref:chemotaxis protein CheW n=1 Tax=unclassified Thioalkalivibrio TaxID=2621013 RepID=UPI00037CCA16|nr:MULTISPECIES: chemotaxis protein CheW [unclassified Thioalkalivibrio]PYG03298.1 twitching motility protein PilI [Thioalkalivibrio sp. ALE21]